MEYILRLTVHEDQWQRQLREVLDLAADTPIREVMLMEQSHKLLTAPFPLEKHRAMGEVYRQMAQSLRGRGIDFSINLATTVGHNDNAIPQRLQLPYERFVGEDLKPCQGVYCITDPGWREYACQVCQIYADIHPKRLMVDDDFRSLNHTAAIGCFCPNHVRLTGERLGYPITQEQLLSACLGEGSLAIKKAWMAVNFQAQLEAAQAMEQAVHAVSPETQVGLMNSGEPNHSVQGRNMSLLLEAFAGPGRQGLSRPLGGAYGDALHQDIPRMLTGMALSMAQAQGDVFWVSEVENYPHSLYTKSLRITQLQMQLHALAGADAISLNLYDYLATPLPLQTEYRQLLKRGCPKVENIAQLRRGKRMRGVGLPWYGDIAQKQRNPSGSVSGLLPSRALDGYLPLLGIPVQLEKGETNFLLGDSVLCCSPQELEDYFRGGVILDNLAAEHLYRMGYGSWLGVCPEGEILEPCVEKITFPELGNWDGTLLCVDWDGIRRNGERITRFVPDPTAQVLTQLLDEEKRWLAPGLLRFQNPLGGCVCIMASPVRELGWLCRGRSLLMQALLKTMPGCEDLPFGSGDMNLAPFYFESPEGEGLLALVNCGLDLAEAVLPERFRKNGAKTVLEPVSMEIFHRLIV